jgi:Pyruvate/2-oxoacid:ferredoxin oxidoreductase delta subunit
MSFEVYSAPHRERERESKIKTTMEPYATEKKIAFCNKCVNYLASRTIYLYREESVVI